MPKTAAEIIVLLKSHANPLNVEGMVRFGINPRNLLGVNLPTLRKLGREIGKDHRLALALWDSGIHEAMILASLIDDPAMVTEAQMERWVVGFDSWGVCDQVIGNLFDKTPYAYTKAVQWAEREEEFVKRAGYVMMATLAVHDKKASDKTFVKFFPLIKKGATDERNFVKKAVNWALRQIGKRNPALRGKAIELAGEIRLIDARPARWIASDALRELQKGRAGT